MTVLSTNPTQAAQSWLADFAAELARNDIDAVLALFEPECYWRDLIAFTWNIRTQEGPDAIRAMLKARLADTRPTAFAVEGEATEAGGVIETWFTFETAVARGRGHLRLRNGKVWTLLTTLTELKGFEEPKGDRRVKGAEHGVHPGRTTWLEQRQQETAERFGEAAVALGAMTSEQVDRLLEVQRFRRAAHVVEGAILAGMLRGTDAVASFGEFLRRSPALVTV